MTGLTFPLNERATVGLDAVRERRCRVIEVRRTDAEHSDLLVGQVLELTDLELRWQIIEIDREERIVHPHTEQLLHRTRLLRPADAQHAVRVVRGTEERDPLDVVPVQVREEEVDRERTSAVAIHERDAELAQSGARVEHEERAGRVTHLDA
jgi:hypothetical protein